MAVSVLKRLRVTAAGDTPDDAIAKARAYLERRGLVGKLLRIRRRNVKTGMIGYKAWDCEFAVTLEAVW